MIHLKKALHLFASLDSTRILHGPDENDYRASMMTPTVLEGEHTGLIQGFWRLRDRFGGGALDPTGTPVPGPADFGPRRAGSRKAQAAASGPGGARS